MDNTGYTPDKTRQREDERNDDRQMDTFSIEGEEERKDYKKRNSKNKTAITDEEKTNEHKKGSSKNKKKAQKAFVKGLKSGGDDDDIIEVDGISDNKSSSVGVDGDTNGVDGKSGNQSSSGGTSGGGTAVGSGGGAINAVAVCGGSAVMASANSVVTLSLHQSIASLNEDFAAANRTTCIDGMTEFVDSGHLGNDSLAHQIRACLGGDNDMDAWSCLSSVIYNVGLRLRYDIDRDRQSVYKACLDKGSSDFYPCVYHNYPDLKEMNGYRVISDFCSYLWSPDSWNITLPDRAPSFARLTAETEASTPSSAEDGEFGNILNYMFLAVSLFFVLIGAIMSVFTGYRITSVIGSLLVAIGFIVASFLDESNEVVVQILVGGVGGIGSAFLKVSALIAVLEYFKGMRMQAIVISGLGAVVINFLMTGLTFVHSIDFDWRTSFRFQAIPATFSLISGIVMMIKGADRDEEDVDWKDKFSKYVFSRQLFKNRVLYLVMILYVLDQAGRPIFSDGMQPYLEDQQFGKKQVDIQPFIENGGSLLGLVLLLLWRRQNMADNLTVMAAMDILVGLLALHVPELRIYAWAVAYSAIYGFSDGVFSSMIQDSIPKGFHKRNIKMVAGLFGLVAGIGTVISDLVKDAIDKKADGKHDSFYFSGGCLIGAGILCIITKLVYEKQQGDEENEMENVIRK